MPAHVFILLITAVITLAGLSLGLAAAFGLPFGLLGLVVLLLALVLRRGGRSS